jgi:hypothetical protein
MARQAKEDSDDPKRDRGCSVCGQPGHNKRTHDKVVAKAKAEAAGGIPPRKVRNPGISSLTAAERRVAKARKALENEEKKLQAAEDRKKKALTALANSVRKSTTMIEGVYEQEIAAVHKATASLKHELVQAEAELRIVCGLDKSKEEPPPDDSAIIPLAHNLKSMATMSASEVLDRLESEKPAAESHPPVVTPDEENSVTPAELEEFHELVAADIPLRQEVVTLINSPLVDETSVAALMLRALRLGLSQMQAPISQARAS